MTESLTDRINTNTPGMDHLLRIYGAGGGIHVSRLGAYCIMSVINCTEEAVTELNSH